MVMEPADFRPREDRTRCRTIHRQRQMRPPLVIIGKVAGQNTREMTLVEDHDMDSTTCALLTLPHPNTSHQRSLCRQTAASALSAQAYSHRHHAGTRVRARVRCDTAASEWWDRRGIHAAPGQHGAAKATAGLQTRSRTFYLAVKAGRVGYGLPRPQRAKRRMPCARSA